MDFFFMLQIFSFHEVQWMFFLNDNKCIMTIDSRTIIICKNNLWYKNLLLIKSLTGAVEDFSNYDLTRISPLHNNVLKTFQGNTRGGRAHTIIDTIELGVEFR
jgi:hypothetical protein